jgi:hypothetical protein
VQEPMLIDVAELVEKPKGVTLVPFGLVVRLHPLDELCDIRANPAHSLVTTIPGHLSLENPEVATPLLEYWVGGTVQFTSAVELGESVNQVVQRGPYIAETVSNGES